MTFKHIKFHDSPVMRSFEQIAIKKGLVKPDILPITKSASSQIDVNPSDNLTHNVLKLCHALRTTGLDQYASELEVNILNYKRAQSLYETSKETGEDVVENAHPKGSHKLDLDSTESIVEDILDKHIKMVNVLNKKPIGKLSTSSAIMAVKLSLGQDIAPKESEAELYQSIDATLNGMLPILGALISRIKVYGGDYDKDAIIKSNQFNYTEIGANEIRSAIALRPFSRNGLRQLLKGLDILEKVKDTGDFGTSFFSYKETNEKNIANWKENVEPTMNKLKTMANSLNAPLKKIETIAIMKEQGVYQEPTKPVVIRSAPEVLELMSEINQATIELNNWKLLISTSNKSEKDKQSATTWLDSQINKFNMIKKQFMELGGDNQEDKTNLQNSQAPQFLSIVKNLRSGKGESNNTFKSIWFS